MKRLYSNLTLAGRRAPQSFAFDGDTAYVLQVADRIGAERRGDLTVSRLNFLTGKLTGRMELRGFDHGVSFGLDRDGAKVWLWVAGRPTVANGSARGTAILRVLFQNRTVKTYANEAKKTHVFKFDGPVTPSVAGDVLAVRSGRLVRCFNLDSAIDGELTQLGQPAMLDYGSRVFQGWCVTPVRDLFTLTGGVGQPAELGTTFAQSRVTRKERHTAPPKGHHEPEGVALWRGRVVFGYSVGAPRRRLAIYSAEL